VRTGARAEPSVCRREWLARDEIAGVVLSTLLVPQGMAYAELAFGLVDAVQLAPSHTISEYVHRVSLVFAELKDPVRRKIERYGLTRTISPHHSYPTIESAVAACRRETGTERAVPRPAANEEGRQV